MLTAPTTMETFFSRFQPDIHRALRDAVYESGELANCPQAALDPFYGQFQYQLGWVDARFSPGVSNTGKLLRPTLLLLAFEAAGGERFLRGDIIGKTHLWRALPAAAAIELTHNFSLIHDDIEDGDEERRHRPTVWKVWGVPQAINTGCGMFSLARLTLWKVVETGVDAATAVLLGRVFDRACITMTEGQHLDISFEDRPDIAVPLYLYLDMIGRKTGALMGCAAEMGAMLATSEQETIACFRRFGQALGIAFQVRDDMLGVWASSKESGKTPAGDIYRHKKSLPVLHALNYASSPDQQRLREIYQQADPLSLEQVEDVLAIFTRTRTKEYCHTFLVEQYKRVQEILAAAPRLATPLSEQALANLSALVRFLDQSITI